MGTSESEQSSSLLERIKRRTKSGGPGWLLSAYTLGSGTAIGSLWAGAQFGYNLLWVQPLAMLMGIIILSGAAYFALSSEKTPYQRFRAELGIGMALSWGLASLFASIIWHFPQYGLAYAAIQGLSGVPDTTISQALIGGSILAVAIALTWSYTSGVGLLIYELLIKLFVWMTILCVGIVVVATPVDWGRVVIGLTSFEAPAGSSMIIFGLLGAAVGINMTFLYPYTVRAKGWGKGDTRLAVRDLITGMMLPFVFATGLLLIASAATLHEGGIQLDRSRITEMAGVFQPVFGQNLGQILFHLGILAMPLGTITLHMLTSGFIVSEMFGLKHGGWGWRLGTLVPAIGVLGVAYPLKGWLPVAASAICLIFLPIAYIGFFLLFRKDSLKPDAAPVKALGLVHLIMLIVVMIISFLAIVKVVDSAKTLFGG